jgi:hypothetical protein
MPGGAAAAKGFGPTGAGGAGGTGRAGAGAGGVGAGGAKGQGDEDEEHKSASYLVETEDVFGDGTLVAPPVIGDVQQRLNGGIMLRSRVMLPVVALYNAWPAEGLSELHRALIAQIDFDDLVGQGWSQLERAGLARGRQIHPDLGRSLRLIAEAGTEYYAFFNSDECDTRSALVVTSGDDALRVILTPDKQFVLEPIRAENAAQSLISALPEVQPGRGGTISLPADAMNGNSRRGDDYDGEGGDSFLQASRPTGPNVAQIEQLKKLLHEKRLGGGQLYVAGRDRFGKKQRCPAPLTYFDTETGRYASLEQPGSDGRPWLTVQPADFRTMTDRLQQLASALS